MTLILTEFSTLGIAMAADSAVTLIEISPSGHFIQQVLKGVTKLHLIHKLNAGISIWGLGRIDGTSSNIWLEDFIRTKEEEYDTLSSFASLILLVIRRYIPDIDVSKHSLGTIGFHLTGFVEWEGRMTPTFYHIHNGISRALELRGEAETINPRKVNANHDLPPVQARELLDGGGAYITFNGDFLPYVTVIRSLSKAFKDLANKLNLIIPYSRSLEDRANWLKFEIKTMAEEKSIIFDIELDIKSYRFYLYSVALSTLFATGIVLLYGSYISAKPVSLTDAETYFYQIFKTLSERGENIEDYVVFYKELSPTSNGEEVSKVGFKLKKVKFNWDFQKLYACFAQMDTMKLSMVLLICIWLIVGASLTLLLLHKPVETPLGGIMLIVSMFAGGAGIGSFLFWILPKSITYRSLLKEFTDAQKIQIDKLYLEAERNPDDLVAQLKIVNAQAMLNRLEQTPSHPIKPLVKIVTVVPFIVGILSYLL